MFDMACGCCKKPGHNVRTCPLVHRAAAAKGKSKDFVMTCGEAALGELVHYAIRTYFGI